MGQFTIKPLEWEKGACYPSDDEIDISFTCLGRYQIKFRRYFGDERKVWTIYLQRCGDFNCEKYIGSRKTLKGAKNAAKSHYNKMITHGLAVA